MALVPLCVSFGVFIFERHFPKYRASARVNLNADIMQRLHIINAAVAGEDELYADLCFKNRKDFSVGNANASYTLSTKLIPYTKVGLISVESNSQELSITALKKLHSCAVMLIKQENSLYESALVEWYGSRSSLAFSRDGDSDGVVQYMNMLKDLDAVLAKQALANSNIDINLELVHRKISSYLVIYLSMLSVMIFLTFALRFSLKKWS